MSSDILRFTENHLVDESVEQYEYYEYQPITGANLTNKEGNNNEHRIAKICSHIPVRAT